MKRYYIIGFILLASFILFIAAASAGPESDVVMGTVGFFGIVALLPLFLYLVIAETRHIEEEYLQEAQTQEEQEAPLVAPAAFYQQHIEKYGARTVGQTQYAKRDLARGVDRDIIEGMRANQGFRPKDAKEEIEPKRDLLHIPERVDKVPEKPLESYEQGDGIQDTKLVDIPGRIEGEIQTQDERHEQLISGLKKDIGQSRTDGKKETENEKEPDKKTDDPHEEKEDEPEENDH